MATKNTAVRAAKTKKNVRTRQSSTCATLSAARQMTMHHTLAHDVERHALSRACSDMPQHARETHEQHTCSCLLDATPSLLVTLCI